MREKLPLKELADEVIEAAVLQASSRVVLFNHVPPERADRCRPRPAEPGADQPAAQCHTGRRRRRERSRRDAGRARDDQRLAGGKRASRSRSGDNGPGIPERVRPKLFEAFQSAAKPGGVGLGLAIAAELIRAHGGEIRLARNRAPRARSFMSPFPTSVVELRPGRRGERLQVRQRLNRA